MIISKPQAWFPYIIFTCYGLGVNDWLIVYRTSEHSRPRSDEAEMRGILDVCRSVFARSDNGMQSYGGLYIYYLVTAFEIML